MHALRAVLRAELPVLLPPAAGKGARVIVVDCVQRSAAWRQARCGYLTASRAHEILANGRGGADSIARRTYRRQLICEQLTGIPEDQPFLSRAMRRGRDAEPAARQAYAARTGQEVRTSGFLAHEELRAGCSLDGYVGDFEGVVELKAPNTTTHLRYFATRRVPSRYRAQITHHLWITGASWCDFVSFDDRLPSRLQLVIVRVWREHVDIRAYEREARRFLAEVRAEVGPLEGLSPMDFFRAASLDVARAVLSKCLQAVEARTRAA